MFHMLICMLMGKTYTVGLWVSFKNFIQRRLQRQKYVLHIIKLKMTKLPQFNQIFVSRATFF